jgi:oligopeptide/dipeptide ABC transporter ATP-binding protein
VCVDRRDFVNQVHTRGGNVPVLEISDLNVEYATGGHPVRALRGVSLRVQRGEKVAVVGESGSGKTSLGMAIPRLLGSRGQITGGHIILDGEDITRANERALAAMRARRVTVIFQDPLNALDPVRRIDSQVAEAIRFRRRGLNRVRGGRMRQLVSDLLDECEIRNSRQVMLQYPHEISGGMRQRVMIAIALAGDCDLLIADEPTTALDVTTQAQILRLLGRLVTQRKVAVMLITHNLALVSGFCDRVVVMYGGRIIEEGPALDVVRRPSHPYTRGLARSIPEIGQGRGRMPSIPGITPDLRRPDDGCAFEPRCYLGHGDPTCLAHMPLLSARTAVEGGRLVRCHLVAEDGTELGPTAVAGMNREEAHDDD